MSNHNNVFILFDDNRYFKTKIPKNSDHKILRHMKKFYKIRENIDILLSCTVKYKKKQKQNNLQTRVFYVSLIYFLHNSVSCRNKQRHR